MSYSRNSSQDLVYNSYSNTYNLASTTYTLTIVPIPNDATVTFTGGTTSGNSVSGICNTIVTYRVSKAGYNDTTASFTLDHNETKNITLQELSNDQFMTGGGGGEPTFLKLNGNSVTILYAWSNGATTFYTTSMTPSLREPLYTYQGIVASDYQIYGKQGAQIIIKKISDNTTAQYSYNASNNKKNVTISNNVFYQNGGGGAGGAGEDWIVGKNNRRRKGGAGGGLYLLNTSTLTTTSIDGKDAGSISNGVLGMFPNVYSGKGGASGTGSGATVVAGQTANLRSGGASGNSSAINPNDDQDDSYFGSGGGGAGGDEDASGGKAGDGNSSYLANTRGTHGYNYHTTPTQPKDQKFVVKSRHDHEYDVSNLGKGGVPAANVLTDVTGKNGWIYMYKYEKEYQTFDMGRIGAEEEAVARKIDGMFASDNKTIEQNLSNSQVVWKTIDGMFDRDGEIEKHLLNSQEIIETIDGDQLYYVEIWKDCGKIDDTNIDETIRLGGI